jgi:hypothetical protein
MERREGFSLMAYTTTITFPIQNISPTETIQLILVFDTNLIGSNRDWDAADYNLRVLNYGKRDASYDLEDAFMVPGKTSMIIGDPDGVLGDLLFGAGAIALTTEKQAKVTKKINGVAAFIGNIIEDTIDFDDGTRILKFTAAPKIDIINKRMVYDEYGNALNPFNYDLTLRYPMAQLVEDIYKLVNPAISFSDGSLEFIHNWKFKGQKYYPNDGYENYLNDFEVYEIEPLIRAYYLDNQASVGTCGDILRKLAQLCCAFTGMISYDKAFFKKLFHYNENNLQTVIVLSRQRGYRYGLIDYVKLNCTFKDVNGNQDFDPNEPYEEPSHEAFTELQDRFILLNSMNVFFRGIPSPSTLRNTNVYFGRVDLGHFNNNDYFVFNWGVDVNIYPAEGAIYSNNGSEFEVIGTPMTAPDDNTLFITTMRISGTNDPDASGTLTQVSGTGLSWYSYTSYSDATGYYNIYQVRDPSIENNAWLNYGEMVAKLWYQYRGNIQNCRVDKFILRGIGYDFLKDFNYDGSKYQPIRMVWNDAEGVTECEAIYLGEL